MNRYRFVATCLNNYHTLLRAVPFLHVPFLPPVLRAISVLLDPVAHHGSHTFAAKAGLYDISASASISQLFVRPSYLSLSISVVLPVNARECSTVPPELIIAGIRVDDSGAVVGGCDLSRAL